MFKRNCVVKFVDTFGIEQAAKVEAESLFEAAVRGLHRFQGTKLRPVEITDQRSFADSLRDQFRTDDSSVPKISSARLLGAQVSAANHLKLFKVR